MSWGGEPPAATDVAGDRHLGVVVVGGSAGALKPMTTVLAGLPGGFPAAIAVVLHRAPDTKSVLSGILRRSTSLEVIDAEAGGELAAGRVVVAPPDRNLWIETDGRVSFRGGRTHYVASAIDPVLESAAAAYGKRVIAVILSGGGNDGTPGAVVVHEAGGVVVVQDPATAGTERMPKSVIDAGVADLVLPATEIAGTLERLVLEGRTSPEERP